MTKVGRNAPCPCGSGKKYKHCCLPQDEHHLASDANPAPTLPESLDPRARERDERTIMQLAGREKFKTDEQYQAFLDYLYSTPVLPAANPPETPLERAQDTMYDAFGAVGSRRVALAKEALAISPDCADAYVLLAEETDEAEKALPLYEQGAAAAGRALGPDFRDRYAGRFWSDLDTRPYLRACYGRADVLSYLGRRDDAIAIAQDLLALNPIDDLGVNYFLLNQLLIAGRDEEAARILDEYADDPATSWNYNAALHKFRTFGDSIFARRALLSARAANPLVIPYILGDQKPPKKPPKDFERLVEEYDAMLYTSIMADAWRNTPGALDWIRRTVQEAEHLPPELAARKTGPRFYLDPWVETDARHCPDCDARTRKRETVLAILVEPSWLLVSKIPGRFCEECGLLTVFEGEVEGAVRANLGEMAPADVEKPSVVLGVIADELMRDRLDAPLDTEWAMAHVEAFREIFEPEEDDWDFALDESHDLLGPVILPAPGHS